MTLVHIDLRNSDDSPASGTVAFTPTLRRSIVGNPDYIILPNAFVAALVDGKLDVELDPTTAEWAWDISERVRGGLRHHVAVPPTPEADYADLVDVEPNSLLPFAEPEAAWWVALSHYIPSIHLAASDPVPLGTPEGTLIIRTA